ncbi:MAG: hypothetical protein GY830_11170 [Bacteroidetes bacterium]|nr:hypothetical protein [Bacteroidota bacterium]
MINNLKSILPGLNLLLKCQNKNCSIESNEKIYKKEKFEKTVKKFSKPCIYDRDKNSSYSSIELIVSPINYLT